MLLLLAVDIFGLKCTITVTFLMLITLFLAVMHMHVMMPLVIYQLLLGDMRIKLLVNNLW